MWWCVGVLRQEDTNIHVSVAYAAPFCNCKPFLDCSGVQWSVSYPLFCSLTCFCEY